jgi:hypothetical protein
METKLDIIAEMQKKNEELEKVCYFLIPNNIQAKYFLCLPLWYFRPKNQPCKSHD